MTKRNKYVVYLEKQYNLLLQQSIKNNSFKVHSIQPPKLDDLYAGTFTIENVNEQDIMDLNIFSPSKLLNTFIFVTSVEVSKNGGEYITNYPLKEFMNQAVSTSTSNKSIIKPYQTLYGPDKININELTDKLQELDNKPTLNMFKKYKITFNVVRLSCAQLPYQNKNNLSKKQLAESCPCNLYIWSCNNLINHSNGGNTSPHTWVAVSGTPSVRCTQLNSYLWDNGNDGCGFNKGGRCNNQNYA
jgi:hypothetical protein